MRSYQHKCKSGKVQSTAHIYEMTALAPVCVARLVCAHHAPCDRPQRVPAHTRAHGLHTHPECAPLRGCVVMVVGGFVKWHSVNMGLRIRVVRVRA